MLVYNITKMVWTESFGSGLGKTFYSIFYQINADLFSILIPQTC